MKRERDRVIEGKKGEIRGHKGKETERQRERKRKRERERDTDKCILFEI